MAYKVHFDDLDSFYLQIGSNVSTWQQLLQTSAETVQTLVESQNMAGDGAENIRAYMGNVHLVIAQCLMRLLTLHASNFLLYKQDYESNIDTALHAVIHSNELTDIRGGIESQRRRAVEVDMALADALRSVSDIFFVSYRDVTDADEAHQTLVGHLDDLNSAVESLEARHLDEDFIETGTMLQSALTFIEQMLGQNRAYKEAFTPQQLAASDAFRELYASAVAVEKALDKKTSAIEAAMKNEEQRVADLTAEYEERQRKAKRDKWILTGVCVIGSIAAIAIIVGTGGTATPLVVGAVSGVSGAVMSGGNNLIDQYAKNGTLKNADWASFGKDALVGGATGFATGYIGAGVGQAVTSWASTTSTGAALLNSSNAAVRFGAGAVIGSGSQITSGVVSRGTGSAVEQLLTEGNVDIRKVGEAAFDKDNMILDGVTGGVSGGVHAMKEPMGKEMTLEDLKDKDVLETKPDHSPAPKRWIEKEGGKIYVDGNGTWTYEYSDGTHVCYSDGYPDFQRAGLVEESVDVGGFSDSRQVDFRKADAVSPKPANTTWHHNQDGHTLEAVSTKYHDIFRHKGGFALANGR